MNDREFFVYLVDEKLKENFDKLKRGSSREKRLYRYIDRAINDLKQNPFCGIKIPKNRWPKIYIKRYKITNLWKYDLPDAGD